MVKRSVTGFATAAWFELCRTKVREYDAIARLCDPHYDVFGVQDIEHRHWIQLWLGDYRTWGKTELKRVQEIIDAERDKARKRGLLDMRLALPEEL